MPRVSRAEAVHSRGPKKGKLKPGCRFVRGGGAVCEVRGIGAARKKKPPSPTVLKAKAQAVSWFDGYLDTLEGPSTHRATFSKAALAAFDAAESYFPSDKAARSAFVATAISEARKSKLPR